MRGKKIILETTEGGCIVPTSHKLNADGYFRTRDPRYTGGGRAPLVMYHRYVWELSNEKIPEGFEVDHICRNRACCNVEHLQLLGVSEHKVKTNKERYAERKTYAKMYWSLSDCTGTELADVMNVTVSTACRWIREWKV